ncbi:MAG: hypothetical protein ABI584_02395 [Acidobacteriota bacterium]
MPSKTFTRDLAAETAKFFRGTPESRLADALRVDPFALDLFLAALPAGTSREEAERVRRSFKQAQRPRASRAKS